MALRDLQEPRFRVREAPSTASGAGAAPLQDPACIDRRQCVGHSASSSVERPLGTRTNYLSTILAGAAIGVATGLDWTKLNRIFFAHWPVYHLLIGALAGTAVALLWDWRARLPFAGKVSSLKLKLPLAGEIELDVTQAERKLLWRFFVELSTRISAQPLSENGGRMREALTSLYSLFGLARDQLASLPPDASRGRGKAPTAGYILRILNSDLRPMLDRWHPRLTDWEKTGMPEAAWPLARYFRSDLEVTRGRIVNLAGALGESMGVDSSIGFLPRAATTLDDLTPAEQLAAHVTTIFGDLSADRFAAGWRIYVEASTRIDTQPLGARDGLLPEAIASLYDLVGLIRSELKAMTPTPGSALGNEPVETIAFRMLNIRLRPFLAKWRSRLPAVPEESSPEALECRADLEAMRTVLVGDADDLAHALGVRRAEALAGTS